MKANACAQSLHDIDPQKFWRNVHKVSNSKANAHVISVGGVSGVHEVADMWKVHFEQDALLLQRNRAMRYVS